MSHQVLAEKIIARSTEDVFNALKAGRLFLNIGCDTNMQIDFRVGGKYHIDFKRMNLKHFGEFLEIIPNKKIVFSWCQTFGPDQKPDSTVSIELFAEGSKTKMVLLHTGFQTQKIADDHRGGWNDGLSGFEDEIQNGRLRMTRGVNASVEKTFDLCKKPESFFASHGKIVEVVPNQKIILACTIGKLSLGFSKKNEEATKLEIIHEGLHTQDDVLKYRKSWEKALQELGPATAKGS